MLGLRRLMIALLSTALLIGMVIPARTTAAPGNLYPIGTHAQAYALIDVSSGRVLTERNGDRKMKIASLTKIMTAIVAIEHGILSDQVKAGKRAVGKEGSSIYLKQGEEMSLHQLLYGLMLRSGNDAATAIAEHVGGSEEGFVYLMNEKAQWIGLESTQFRNPHGLDQEGHYSTANDLAKLTAYALQNAAFQEIVKTKVKTVPDPGQTWDRKWVNKNKMLTFYEGADGVKTGYTKQALRCLVSSATRNGQQLAVVTLNDPNDWTDHRRLLDFGFQQFPLKELVTKGQRIEGHLLEAGRTFLYPLTNSEANRLKRRLVLNRASDPENSSSPRGLLEFYLDSHKIGDVPVYELESPTGTETRSDQGTFSASESAKLSMLDYLSIVGVVWEALFTQKGGSIIW